MIRIVTRGDDAGSSKSANRAIRETCEKGVLKNISVLANGPFVKDAAEVLKDLPGICFGVHGCVTSEWDNPRWGPVIGKEKGAALLDGQGYFNHQVMPLHENKVPAGLILEEIEAQLTLLRKLGFDIKYIDEHMGFAWLDGVAEGIFEIARREGLIFRPELERFPYPESKPGLNGMADMVSVGIEMLKDGKTYLLVGHPTYNDEEMHEVYRENTPKGAVGIDREQQRLGFMREDIVARYKELGIQPIRYDEI